MPVNRPRRNPVDTDTLLFSFSLHRVLFGLIRNDDDACESSPARLLAAQGFLAAVMPDSWGVF